MQFGYMPSFFEKKIKLASEIEFAKKHFDFIEITLPFDVNAEFVEKAKNALSGMKLIGHFYWELDLSGESNKGLADEIKNYIIAYKKINAEKVVVHPCISNEKIKVENNKTMLGKINLFCASLGIECLLENNRSAPYNNAGALYSLVAETGCAGITLDVGHANAAGSVGDFIRAFGSRIEHVHLHHNIGEMDHLVFPTPEEIEGVGNWLSKINYNKTITLEMFYKIKNGVRIELTGAERRKHLLSQLRIIRNVFN